MSSESQEAEGALMPPEDETRWVEDPRLAWHMLAVLFFSGATVGALSLVLPHPPVYDVVLLWANVALAYAASAALFIAPRILPPWSVHAFVIAGIIVITRAIYLSNDPGGFYTMWYVWVGLYAFFFLGRRAGLAHLAALGIAYAVVLAQLPGVTYGIARWTMVMATLAVGGLMVDALAGRLRGLAARHAAIAGERADLLVKLEKIARTDELTGLPNRRAWDEELARDVARAGRDEQPLCVAMLDLDRFKEYNDLSGHLAGDRFLKAVTAAWRGGLRTTDSLARYGGEEFALVLPGCDLEDATTLVEALRAVVPEGQTCSAGIAAWDGAETPAGLLGRADMALYEAKKAGRDRVVASVP